MRFFPLVGALFVLACSSDSAKTSGSGAGGTSGGGGAGGTLGTVCAPGATQTCVGLGVCAGVQSCQLDGRAWASCQCSGSAGGSGGSASAGGSGASAGSGGSAGTGASGGTGAGGSGGFGFDGGGVVDGGCAPTPMEGTRSPSRLLVVLDRSESMKCNLPPTTSSAACEASPSRANQTQPSKWEATCGALLARLGALTPSPALQVGFSLFPRDDACSVSEFPSLDMKLLTPVHEAAAQSLLQAVVPDGRTPLAGAAILAYAHILTLLQAGGTDGSYDVLLVADGGDTCAPGELDKLVNTDVPNAHSGLGVRTFVIGAPGSEGARSLLSQIAKNGGTASAANCTADENGPDSVGDCHHDLSTAPDYGAALSATLEQVVANTGCEYATPTDPGGGPLNPSLVNVSVSLAGGGSVSLVQDTGDCANGADGWQYSSDQSTIILCGAACVTSNQVGASVSVEVGCPTIVR